MGIGVAVVGVVNHSLAVGPTRNLIIDIYGTTRQQVHYLWKMKVMRYVS
jgi:hypothetical protein